MKRKPILSVDFDGVIHSYTSGWKGADVVTDPPVPGALEFLIDAVDVGWDVHIFSTRNHQEGGIEAIQSWLISEYDKEEYVLPLYSFSHSKIDATGYFVANVLKWPITKPPSLVMIDDRAFHFHGWWPDPESLKNFKPWNKVNQ